MVYDLTYNESAHQRGRISDWVIVAHPPAPDIRLVFKMRATDTGAVRDRVQAGEANISFLCVNGLMSLGRRCRPVMIHGALLCFGGHACVDVESDDSILSAARSPDAQVPDQV